jgi:hypothetical protein
VGVGLGRAHPVESTLRMEKSDKAWAKQYIVGLPFGPGEQSEGPPHPLVVSSKGTASNTATTGGIAGASPQTGDHPLQLLLIQLDRTQPVVP